MMLNHFSTSNSFGGKIDKAVQEDLKIPVESKA